MDVEHGRKQSWQSHLSRRTEKIHHQDSQFQCRDLKPEPLKYETVLLTKRLCRLAGRSRKHQT
jgi:hypothetical protein